METGRPWELTAAFRCFAQWLHCDCPAPVRRIGRRAPRHPLPEFRRQMRPASNGAPFRLTIGRASPAVLAAAALTLAPPLVSRAQGQDSSQTGHQLSAASSGESWEFPLTPQPQEQSTAAKPQSVPWSPGDATAAESSTRGPGQFQQSSGGQATRPRYFDARGAANSSMAVLGDSQNPDRWIKLGAGLRASANTLGNPEFRRPAYREHFTLENARIYLDGQGGDHFGVELNVDIANAQYLDLPTTPREDGGTVRLLDGIGKFRFSDQDSLNVWIGRMTVQNSRANVSGAFATNAYLTPFNYSYPTIFQGRDDGITAWGLADDKHLKWYAGFFQGLDQFADPLPADDVEPEFNARVVYNFWDAEPGYYNKSTYYGEKDILAIGAAVHTQLSPTKPPLNAPFTGYTLEFMFENTLANDGVATVVGEYFNYDITDGPVTETLATFPRLGIQGEAWYLTTSYLFPHKVSLGNVDGQIQTLFRYQQYDREFEPLARSVFSNGYDLELNYIISGHDAQLRGVWHHRDPTLGDDLDVFRLATQMQF